MKTRFLILATLLYAWVSATAQIVPPFQPSDETGSDKETTAGKLKDVDGFWQAKVAGGEYAVAVARITSVSRHSYVLDGTLVVDEVTIDTTGQALARFYFLQPLGAENSPGGAAAGAVERAKGIVDRAEQRSGVDVGSMVIKKYPETTHARTIEYRLASQAELTNLFNSAKQAWQSGKGGHFTSGN